MRRHLLILIPVMLSGCVPVMCSLPIVAKDPIWNGAGAVTLIDGRMVTINGVATQIAGLDISKLSDAERQAFDTALADMVRNRSVVAQPVSPGVSRLWVAGDPVYRAPKLMACGPAIPLFIPHIAPARPDRIDVAQRLLRAGLAHAVPGADRSLPQLPSRSNIFFVPQFPLRIGEKAEHLVPQTYETTEAIARAERVGIFATAPARSDDDSVALLRQEGHDASGSLPDFE